MGLPNSSQTAEKRIIDVNDLRLTSFIHIRPSASATSSSSFDYSRLSRGRAAALGRWPREETRRRAPSQPMEKLRLFQLQVRESYAWPRVWSEY
eukprot:scaffold238758_cov32-Tisochrysis_lutea.AAC.1